MSTSTSDPSAMSKAVNENDKGALITLAAALGLGFSLFFLLFRLYTRRPIREMYKIDDTATTIATVLAVGQVAATIAAVNHGLGERQSRLRTLELRAIFKAYLASDILFITSLAFAKLAVVLLIYRLTNNLRHHNATHICTGLITFWALLAVILISIPCHGQPTWINLDPSCSLAASKWTVIAAFDVITEICLLILPLYFLWSIQIKKKTRIFALSVFWARICVPVFALWRLQQIQDLQSSDDYMFDSVEPSITTQIQMHAACIFATIPGILPFLKAFNTGYLVPNTGYMESSRHFPVGDTPRLGYGGDAGTNLNNMENRGHIIHPNDQPTDTKSTLPLTLPTSLTATFISTTAISPETPGLGLDLYDRSKSPSRSGNDENHCNTRPQADGEPGAGRRQGTSPYLGPLRLDQVQHETVIESLSPQRRRDGGGSLRLGASGRRSSSRNSNSSRSRIFGGYWIGGDQKRSSTYYADGRDGGEGVGENDGDDGDGDGDDDNVPAEELVSERLERDQIFVCRTVDVDYEDVGDGKESVEGRG